MIICTLSCEPWTSEVWWAEVEELTPERRLRSAPSSLGSMLALPAGLAGDFLLDDDGSVAGRQLRAQIEDILAHHDHAYDTEDLDGGPCRVALQLPAPLGPFP